MPGSGCDCDLRPFFAGEVDAVREELHWDTRWQWAVRRGEWKLRFVEPNSPYADEIRRVEHTEPGSGLHLVNLREDAGESRDLAAERPDIVDELRAVREGWRARMDAAAAR